MKKCLPILLSICVCVVMFSLCDLKTFAAGDGTESNPYLVSELMVGAISVQSKSCWIKNDVGVTVYIYTLDNNPAARMDISIKTSAGERDPDYTISANNSCKLTSSKDDFYVQSLDLKGSSVDPYLLSELTEGEEINSIEVKIKNDTGFTVNMFNYFSLPNMELYFSRDANAHTTFNKRTLINNEVTGVTAVGGGKVIVREIDLSQTPDPEDPVAPEEKSGNYLTPLEDKLAETVEVISSSPSTEPQTVTWDVGDSLPIGIMTILKDNPSISLLFDFEYEGVKHTVLIPAGEAFVDDDIEWYGPLWLLGKYGEYNPEAKKYEVQSGDSLKTIAEKNGISLEELIEKNPQINDVNRIYPGETINL